MSNFPRPTLRKGDCASGNWREINDARAQIARHQAKLSQMAGQIAELQRRLQGGGKNDTDPRYV